MAKERNLPQKTTLTTSDYIRVVGSDNASYKQIVSDVVEAIVGASAKALPSSITDLNNITATSIYLIVASIPTNAPTTSIGAWSAYVQTVRISSTYAFQNYVIVNANAAEVYYRRYLNGTWTSWIKMPTRAEIDALNSKTAVTVTASTNVVIDTNKSYKCGNILFLNVKGHATADLSNASLFVFAGATVSPNAFTFGIPISDSAWTVNGITYGYINSNGVVGTVGNGKYFHIAQSFICS